MQIDLRIGATGVGPAKVRPLVGRAAFFLDTSAVAPIISAVSSAAMYLEEPSAARL